MLLWALAGLAAVAEAGVLPAGKRAAVEKFHAREGGACDFPKVNASGMSSEAFLRLHAGKHAVVLESIDGIEELMKGTSEAEIVAEHGAKAVALEAGIEEQRANFRLKIEHQRVLNDYVYKQTGGQELVFELGNFGNFSRVLWKKKQDSLPALMAQMMANPMTTLGNKGSGTNMHRHRESILLQLKGRKAWWIASGDNPNSNYFGTYSPCQFLGARTPPNFKFCVQRPGQMVYFPTQWWHATCNIDDFTWGIGGQGRTTEWPAVVVKAGEGDVDAVSKAVTAEVKRGELTRSVYSAILHRALIFSRTAVVQELLRHGRKLVDAPVGEMVDDHFTTSPVHAAVVVGDVARVKQLLEMGFDPEDHWSPQSAMVPLEMASNLGHVALVELFAKKGGPRLTEDFDEVMSKCLNGAAVDGHLKAVKRLLKAGADPSSPSMLGHLAVHVAAAGGQLHVVKHIVGKRKSFVHEKDRDGNTPLHAASEHGHREVVEFLLAKKAKHGVSNEQAMHPIHLAAQQGHVGVVETLLDARAGVRDEVQGSTPLHFAAGLGALGVCELLVARRAEVRAVGGGKMQPLHVAAFMGSGRFVAEFLVARRARLDARNVQGQDPLALAREQGHVPTVAALRRLRGAADEDEEEPDEDEDAEEKPRPKRKGGEL